MAMDLPRRAHLITGGFPPGQPAGHDHDYARIRILEMLEEQEIPASVANDYHDVERWLPISRLLITYTAGPYMNDDQAGFVRGWIEEGGRWLGLHGSSGGRAVRTESGRRRMLKTDHHHTLGGFFLSHPPVRRFQVDVVDPKHPLTKNMPESFEVIDEPYMIEMQRPPENEILLTSALGPDPNPNFGFEYGEDTALMPDGMTRVLGYVRQLGEGGVAYTALGHCHTPATNSQPFVDTSVDPEGRTPPTLRVTWESEAYRQLLRNAVAWGAGI